MRTNACDMRRRGILESANIMAPEAKIPDRPMDALRRAGSSIRSWRGAKVAAPVRPEISAHRGGTTTGEQPPLQRPRPFKARSTPVRCRWHTGCNFADPEPSKPLHIRWNAFPPKSVLAALPPFHRALQLVGIPFAGRGLQS